MAAQKLVFDAQQISNSAKLVDDHNDKLYNTLRAAQDKVDSIRDWEGNAGDASLRKFEQMANQYFRKIHGDIGSYATFLRRAVQDYERTEGKITSEAAKSTGRRF